MCKIKEHSASTRLKVKISSASKYLAYNIHKLFLSDKKFFFLSHLLYTLQEQLKFRRTQKQVSPNKPIADLHNHLTLFYELKDSYNDTYKTPVENRLSQENLTDLLKSKTRLIINSIYVLEKDWYLGAKRKRPHGYKRILQRVFIKSPLLLHKALRILLGMKVQRFDFLVNNSIYFDEYQDQYKHLVELVRKNEGSLYLLKPGDKIRDINKIVIVNSIEGAHILSLNEHNRLSPKNQIQARIKILKNQKYRPLYITLAHLFNNRIVGHSRSIQGRLSSLIPQETGLNEGLTSLGKTIIEELLCMKSTCKSKRILIDCKHMSILARTQYYQIITKYNNTHRKKIPILFSHTAFSGYDTIQELQEASTYEKRSKIDYGNYNGFDGRSINLCGEEVQLIYQSKGLIGIILERKALSGKENRENHKQTDYAQEIWRNIRSMASYLTEQEDDSIWDIFCIGSDFNGLISTPIKYSSLTKLQKLEIDLIDIVKNDPELKTISFGKHPEEIVRKFMYKNLEDFISQHY